MDIPAFHPEWIVTFWLSTPGLNKVDPHLLLLTVITLLVSVYFYKRRRNGIPQPDAEEEKFQHLLTTKQVLEKELLELEGLSEQGISNEQYLKKKQELEKHLDLTKQRLQQFTI